MNYYETKKSSNMLIHPGETLQEVIEDRKISVEKLSVKTGVSENFINDILSCQKGITDSFAVKLENVLGIKASFWINLQKNYELDIQ